MTPFIFGGEGRRLFGVLHRAPGSGRGVVLIPPYGQEALRAHRALRILADAYAAAGWNALRFDPYGTGDSEGDDVDVTLEGMVADAHTAAAELTAATGAKQLAAFGLRLGGVVALEAAAAFKALMLWEPLIDPAALARRISPGGELEGFRWSPALRQGLLAPRPQVALPRRGLLLWSGDEAGAGATEAYTAALQARLERLEVRHVPSPPAWTEENDFGAGPVPVTIIDALASWRG